MSLSETYIARLLLKQLTGEITAEERTTLEQWAQSSPANRQKFEELTSRSTLQQRFKNFTEAAQQAEHIAPPVPRVHRLQYLKWAAAAAIILIAAATYLYTNKKTPDTNTPVAPVADIIPGGNKAILTLSDGSHITLDSAANGQLAIQGNTRIVKDTNGRLAYSPDQNPAATTALNTLSTPNGGQYQLTLPDGTNVWLNAASAITFPTAFTGTQRKISISGEAYFEVAKDKTRPFIVEIKDKQTIEVLGTSFDIDAYDNEAQIRSTLITGSIRVTQASSHQAAAGVASAAASVVLKPGQQSQLTAAHLTVKEDAGIDKAIAWKNGLFDFDGADVPTVMRQLERWYDIHVQYNNAIPLIHFRGELDRGVNLSEILKILPKMGIRYRLEGRTLIVL